MMIDATLIEINDKTNKTTVIQYAYRYWFFFLKKKIENDKIRIFFKKIRLFCEKKRTLS